MLGIFFLFCLPHKRGTEKVTTNEKIGLALVAQGLR
jgi:hypothetical protein